MEVSYYCPDGIGEVVVVVAETVAVVDWDTLAIGSHGIDFPDMVA